MMTMKELWKVVAPTDAAPSAWVRTGLLLAALLAGCGGRTSEATDGGQGDVCFTCPGVIGTPCAAGGDCASGICLPVRDAPEGRGWTRSVCSAACVTAADCPPGWDCVGMACQCSYATEVANGRDDDCDGVVDNVRPSSGADKVDILFMIDNSDSTGLPRVSLIQYFRNFLGALTAGSWPPDLHIGIVTSDLGPGQFTPPSCERVGGDQGELQNTPMDASHCGLGHLDNPADRFLQYVEVGGTTQSNFTGDLAEAFGCYANLSEGSCGFEHQLASVRAAMDDCNSAIGCAQPANSGFLRRDALLAVVLLTDEDDCSAPSDSTLFDPSQTTLTAPLGPLTSYRCFEFGTLCDGAPPGREEGPRANCAPGAWDPDRQHQLTPVEEFVAFLRGLKPPDPRLVYVAVIAGTPAPVTVVRDSSGYPLLEPCCDSATGNATSGLRLQKFVNLFDADRARFEPICATDLSGAMTHIGEDIAGILGQ
jgi:hypothetical protein